MGLDEREAQLRRSLLTHCRIMGSRAVDGWVSASAVAVAARDDSRHGVDSEPQASRLIDELIEWGLLAEKAKQPTGAGLKADGDLRYRLVKITDMEWKRFTGKLDPIPGVAE